MNDVVEKAIETFGEEMQTFIAIEEMAELMKELSKKMRGSTNKDSIIEEIADVYIVLNELMIMNGIDLNDVVNVMNSKLERLNERLKDESV